MKAKKITRKKPFVLSREQAAYLSTRHGGQLIAEGAIKLKKNVREKTRELK